MDALQRADKILTRDAQIVEHLGRDGGGGQIDARHDPAHRLYRRLAGQRGNVRADEAVSGASEFGDIDAFVERHAAGVDGEYLAAAAFVGYADDDLAVEAAGAAQRLVDRIGAVGGGDDDKIGTRLQPVHQREQLRNEALLCLARDLAALGGDAVDLVDEDDRGGGLRGLFEHVAQALFGLAIGAAHDFRTVDQKEFGLALVGDGAGKAGLAGAGRAIEQHALGRIDAEALEQLGVAQRQLDHLAQLVDGVAHAANIVVGDVGTARFLGLGIFGAELDLGRLVDMDDALGHRRHHRQADFLQGIGRCGEHLAQLRGHIVRRDTLLPGGGDDIACNHRATHEAAAQALTRPLQLEILLGRRERDFLCGFRFRLAQRYQIAGADTGIGALQAVEADDLYPLILGIRADGDARGGAFADNLDDIALCQTKAGQQLARNADDAASGLFGPDIGHLHLGGSVFAIGQTPTPSR